MRLGLLLDPSAPEDHRAEATAAARAGFDLIWIPTWLGSPGQQQAGLQQAAALASARPSTQIGVTIEVGETHPVILAEQIAVADRLLIGRLVVGLVPAKGAPSDFDESLEIILRSNASRPFRFSGSRWSVPGRLPQNAFAHDEELVVTPSPDAIEVPYWISRDPTVTTRYGLSYLGHADQSAADLAGIWGTIDTELQQRALRMRRPAIRPLTDPSDLLTTLRKDQHAWGCDIVVVDLATTPGSERIVTIAEVGRRVWPFVQMPRYPEGLETHWNQRTIPEEHR